MPKHIKTEAEWQGENDAQSLAEAAAIRADKKRMSMAKKMAIKMAKEQQVKATALKRVSKAKVKK